MVYFGFALGFFNTYLFTREGGFTKEQYGLTGIFVAVANLMFSLANFGMPSYIYKFYPYYNDNLDKKRYFNLGPCSITRWFLFCGDRRHLF
jgi:O-antigen/teichoic acid export membrane protein